MFSAASTLIPDNAPGANYIKPWVPFLNALAVGLVGFTARQNNKSTEEVTGKTPTPVVPVEPIAKP